MADGGWTYYNHTEYAHDGSQASEQAAMAGLQVALEAMTGWSRHQDQTLYNSRCLWWALENDATGARVVFAYAGNDSSGNVLIAEVDAYNSTRTASGYEGALWICYVPASFSATALGTNPATSGFLPTNSLKFYAVSGGEIGATTDGHRMQYDWFVRGDGMILAPTRNAQSDSRFTSLHIMGHCLSLAHAGDSGVNADAGHLTWATIDHTNVNWLHYLNDGTVSSNNTLLQINQESLTGPGVNSTSKWSWYSPVVYVSTNDLDNGGVVVGSGVKGTINSEWMRVLATPERIAPRTQLNGGNFVYLGGGIAVGYDTSNGAM